MLFSLLWIAVSVLDLVALVSLLKSSADTTTKILWVLLILLIPLFGRSCISSSVPAGGRSCRAMTDD